MGAKRFLFLTLAGLFAWSASFASGPTPSDPLYIRTDNGYKGVYAHGDEYAEFAVTGAEIKLQDPYHMLLKPRVGLMVAFAEKSQFAAGADTLAAHEEWELNYWRQHAAKAEGVVRNDLSSGKNDLRVTEITLTNAAGEQAKLYMVSLSGKDGVFVLSIAPVDPSVDSLVANIAGSFKIVHRQLDPDEIKRLSSAAAAGSR